MDLDAWNAGIPCEDVSVGVVEEVALQVAIGRAYFPCQGCLPEAGGRS